MMSRCEPGSSGTFDFTAGLSMAEIDGVLTSMNVRRHLFLQK